MNLISKKKELEAELLRSKDSYNRFTDKRNMAYDSIKQIEGALGLLNEMIKESNTKTSEKE
jgi:hypothetical protein